MRSSKQRNAQLTNPLTLVCNEDAREVYYEFTVPETGEFKLSLSSEVGVAVYEDCNGNNLFCKYPETINQVIENLTPNSNVIIQFFDFLETDQSDSYTFCINSNDTYNKCNIYDWTALKAIYESTHGDDWINNNGWEQINGDTPPENCDLSLLYGISLNTEGRVSCIDLDGIHDCTFTPQSSGNNLTGPIPDEIYMLSELNELCLNNNQITGKINTQLSKLSGLKMLLLHGNQLSGTIPVRTQ